MPLVVLALLLGLAACTSPSPETAAPPAAAADTVRADWGDTFARRGVVGTFVLYDPATGRTSRYNPERAATRFTPASTSKVFNALVFLDQGVVTDPDSLIAWDGVERRIASWNRDHSLRSGVEVSAVWLFQRLALEVGRDGYADVFSRQPYGNATMGEPLEMAWLDGSLRISADEQVAFLEGLRRGTLAFDPAHQATVCDLVPVLLPGLAQAEGDGHRLKAKTGWGLRDGQPDLGWLVGWVERPEGDVVFALNVEAASPEAPFEMGPGRLEIARELLSGEGLLPGSE